MPAETKDPEMPEMPNMFKMFLPLSLVYGMKYIDAENPTNIFYMRAFFAVGQVSMLLLWLFLNSQVKTKDDQRKLEVSTADLQPPNPLGDMLGANKLLPKDKKKMTYREYDESQCFEKIKAVFMQGLIVGGIHWKWGTVLPLVMSVVMALVDLPENPIVRIYLLGQNEADHKDLKRPFKVKSPFSGFKDAMDKAKKASEAKDGDGETDEDTKGIEDDEDESTDVGPTEALTGPVEKHTFKGTSGLGFRLFCSETEKGNWHLLGDVEDDGQADKFGLKIGHNVVSVDGEKCADLDHKELLSKFVDAKQEGRDVVVELQFSEMWSQIVKTARCNHAKLGEPIDDKAWFKIFSAAERCFEEHAVELADNKNYRKKNGGGKGDDVEEVDISTSSGDSANRSEGSTLEDRMQQTCLANFKQFEANAAKKEQEKMTPGKILYNLVLVYCIASMFLPIKPTDLMKMIAGNATTVAVGGDAGSAASMGEGVPEAVAHDEFDDL